MNFREVDMKTKEKTKELNQRIDKEIKRIDEAIKELEVIEKPKLFKIKARWYEIWLPKERIVQNQ